ncbi:hypothetical protein [Phaeovulum sp. W22_SRMD_FR3]|uniref:hypothetical protein n=1 Tax=Phaeovulum sp. W22_SRMD_FR3 TaxID=3240274 RepID=UPI003F9DD5FB
MIHFENTRYAAKMARIRAGSYARGDFILADAKDANLSGGIHAAGLTRNPQGVPGRPRSRTEFLAQMRGLIVQDKIDIMLGSAANIEALAEAGAFDTSPVAAAFRGNEATDMWGGIRGGRYRATASLPHRGADLARAPAALCLYSITFNNDAAADARTLEAYAAFRADAEKADVTHFLEVFNPNLDTGFSTTETGAYVTDCICRALGSLTRAERPAFLKVAYNGPGALEELAAHDPSVIVGILGGGGGTHRDTFELVVQAERHGARLALFGRKINMAEDQPTFITWLRRVADGEVDAAEAVRGYHADLGTLGLRPDRGLDIDATITEDVLRHAAH